MNRAWVQRRTNNGMRRIMARLERQARRRKHDPLPLVLRTKIPGIDATMTITPPTTFQGQRTTGYWEDEAAEFGMDEEW